MGTEIFLKGMWLCQFDECRTLTNSSYIDQATRRKYFEDLGPNGLGHNLIEILNELRKIREYAEDAAALQFLDLIERIIRRYYWPPYEPTNAQAGPALVTRSGCTTMLLGKPKPRTSRVIPPASGSRNFFATCNAMQIASGDCKLG